MQEQELQNAVIELARLLGWTVAHFRPAQTSRGWRTPVQADGAGFPDLVLIHPTHGLLIRELKTTRGPLRPEQTRWLDLFTRAGVDAGVWRPADWTDGRIETELRAAVVRHRQPPILAS